MKRILRWFRLAPYSQVRKLSHELLMLDDAYKDLHRQWEQTEARLWARYMNRLKNDIHMSLSWMYSEHVRRCSMGVPPVSVPQEQWPYYAKAMQLNDAPTIKPEKL